MLSGGSSSRRTARTNSSADTTRDAARVTWLFLAGVGSSCSKKKGFKLRTTGLSKFRYESYPGNEISIELSSMYSVHLQNCSMKLLFPSAYFWSFSWRSGPSDLKNSSTANLVSARSRGPCKGRRAARYFRHELSRSGIGSLGRLSWAEKVMPPFLGSSGIAIPTDM